MKRVTPKNPAQYIVLAFLLMSAIGTGLLMLPFATVEEGSTSITTALFTAVSAVCVTGLVVVDTPTHWTGFGEAVILGLIQIGGLGIMTLTSLLLIILSKKLGLKQRILAASQTGSLRLGDVKTLVIGVAKMTLFVESVIVVILFFRFWLTYSESPGRALYLAVFHSISAFNNAGFALYSDSLVRFQSDEVVLFAISFGVIIGGLGYPVWRQILANPRRFKKWDLHAKMTVTTTLGLIIVGAFGYKWFEWTNPATLGHLSTWDSLVNAYFQSATSRTAGFNAIDIPGMNDTSHLLTTILMFIGGGSASTAGGIKITTFALLGWVMWAEVRGEKDVTVFSRRVPTSAQRQALTVALLAVGGAISSTMVLLAITKFEFYDVIFEVVSALGTVGLSNGITPGLEEPARVFVAALMFIGRVGPPTIFAALVLRDRDRQYRYPEERIIIG